MVGMHTLSNDSVSDTGAKEIRAAKWRHRPPTRHVADLVSIWKLSGDSKRVLTWCPTTGHLKPLVWWQQSSSKKAPSLRKRFPTENS